jgi:hypothetical protein
MKKEKDYKSGINEYLERIENTFNKINTLKAWATFQYRDRTPFLDHPVFVSDSCEDVFIEKCRLLNLFFQLKEYFNKIKRTLEGRRFLKKNTFYQPLLEHAERRVACLVR